jgi:hypothetical protein
MGNNSNGWQAITSWGVAYEAAEGNPATNTRVNIRDMQTYFLQKSTGKWLLLQNTSAPDGAAYVEDFSGDNRRNRGGAGGTVDRRRFQQGRRPRSAPAVRNAILCPMRLL